MLQLGALKAIMEICLPHNQEAETGAQFSVKGGTTGGWKSKHRKC